MSLTVKDGTRLVIGEALVRPKPQTATAAKVMVANIVERYEITGWCDQSKLIEVWGMGTVAV